MIVANGYLTSRVLTIVAACFALATTTHSQTSSKAASAEFQGTFVADLPETVGQSAPLIRWTLRCQDRQCALTMGNQAGETYDKVEPARPEHLSQARFAVKYAKEHKVNGKKDAPYLLPLLDSQSDIQSCIDLGYTKPAFPGAEIPGLTLACTLQPNPWRHPVILMLGTLMANCGPVFCRFEIVPFIKE